MSLIINLGDVSDKHGEQNACRVLLGTDIRNFFNSIQTEKIKKNCAFLDNIKGI